MSNTDISSYNQSGGFTGINRGTVNLAPPPRTISPADRAEFISYLRKSPKGRVDVWFDASDPESNAFAEQLVSLLNEAGYPATIGGGFMAAVSPPLIGVIGCVADGDHPPMYAAYVRAGLEHINMERREWSKRGLGKTNLVFEWDQIPRSSNNHNKNNGNAGKNACEQIRGQSVNRDISVGAGKAAR